MIAESGMAEELRRLSAELPRAIQRAAAASQPEPPRSELSGVDLARARALDAEVAWIMKRIREIRAAEAPEQ